MGGAAGAVIRAGWKIIKDGVKYDVMMYVATDHLFIIANDGMRYTVQAVGNHYEVLEHGVPEPNFHLEYSGDGGGGENNNSGGGGGGGGDDHPGKVIPEYEDEVNTDGTEVA